MLKILHRFFNQHVNLLTHSTYPTYDEFWTRLLRLQPPCPKPPLVKGKGREPVIGTKWDHRTLWFRTNLFCPKQPEKTDTYNNKGLTVEEVKVQSLDPFFVCLGLLSGNTTRRATFQGYQDVGKKGRKFQKSSNKICIVGPKNQDESPSFSFFIQMR